VQAVEEYRSQVKAPIVGAADALAKEQQMLSTMHLEALEELYRGVHDSCEGIIEVLANLEGRHEKLARELVAAYRAMALEGLEEVEGRVRRSMKLGKELEARMVFAVGELSRTAVEGTARLKRLFEGFETDWHDLEARIGQLGERFDKMIGGLQRLSKEQAESIDQTKRWTQTLEWTFELQKALVGEAREVREACDAAREELESSRKALAERASYAERRIAGKLRWRSAGIALAFLGGVLDTFGVLHLMHSQELSVLLERLGGLLR